MEGKDLEREWSIVNIELHTWAHWRYSWSIVKSLGKYLMDL